jgi:CBS domain-containing protein
VAVSLYDVASGSSTSARVAVNRQNELYAIHGRLARLTHPKTSKWGHIERMEQRTTLGAQVAFLWHKAKRVRIYVSQNARSGPDVAYVAMVRFLQKERAAGATVYRAIEGFGSSGRIHSARLADVVDDQPVVVEWIDSAERVERLLPRLKTLVSPGLVTIEDTDIVVYNLHPVRRISDHVTAAEVMSANPVSVVTDASVRDVVDLLVGKPYRAIPVIDGAIPVGIITNSDLVVRGGLASRVDLLLVAETLRAELERLAATGLKAGDIMTRAPVTCGLHAPITQVAETMARRRFKRLPVVDEHGRLAGIISRYDILRTVAEGFDDVEATAPRVGLNGSRPVSEAMRSDVPTVHPSAPVSEVMQAVLSTRLNRVLVVDSDRRVVGIVSDAALLERATPSLRPSAMRLLLERLPLVHPSSPATIAMERHAVARTAQALMSTDVVTVPEDRPLREVIGPMLASSQKLVAVLDGSGRLAGTVDRSDLLQAVLKPAQ